jgi:hypothetical protein
MDLLLAACTMALARFPNDLFVGRQQDRLAAAADEQVITRLDGVQLACVQTCNCCGHSPTHSKASLPTRSTIQVSPVLISGPAPHNGTPALVLALGLPLQVLLTPMRIVPRRYIALRRSLSANLQQTRLPRSVPLSRQRQSQRTLLCPAR